MKTVARVLFVLLMPVVLIAGGMGLAGLAMDSDIYWLVWVGIALILLGVLWAIVVYLWVDMRTW